MLKKLLLGMLIIFSSCAEEVDTIKNYKNAVVVGKPITTIKYSDCRIQIRYWSAVGAKYKVKYILIPRYEYESVHLGDTIK